MATHGFGGVVSRSERRWPEPVGESWTYYMYLSSCHRGNMEVVTISGLSGRVEDQRRQAPVTVRSNRAGLNSVVLELKRRANIVAFLVGLG